MPSLTESTPWFATRRDDAVSGICAAWMVLGLFADGWAHRNDKPESFFSPWHGVLYSGFLASALWMLRITRNGRSSGRRSVPVGYGVRLVGLGVFAAAGLADFAWHSAFGIEADVEALLSPPHLFLLGGGLLIGFGPIASTLARERERADSSSAVAGRATWSRTGAAVAAVTFIVSVLGFFVMEFSPFDYGHFDRATAANLGTHGYVWSETVAAGVAGIIVFSVLAATALLWVVRNLALPRGALLLLLGVPPVLQSMLSSFDEVRRIAGALVAAVIAELTAHRVMRLRWRGARAAWVGLLTLITWLGMFAAIASGNGVGWSAELWSGSSVLAAMLCALLALSTEAPEPDR